MEEEKKKETKTPEIKEKKTEAKVEVRTKKKNKTRMKLVLLFIVLFAVIAYIAFRGSYLQYLELGQNYVNVFNTNFEYKSIIMGINFVFLYIVMYFTNKGIKKGLTEFFKKEKKEVPKLLNKSLALVVATIGSVIVGTIFTDKIMLAMSNSSFGIADPIFNLDIGFYIFQKSLIEMFIAYFMILIVGLTVYMALYYIIVFNKCFNGIDGKMLKESDLIKKIKRNVVLASIGIALFTIVNIFNIMYGTIADVENEYSITGAGYTESTVQLGGYIILAFVIIIAISKAVKSFSKGNTKKVLKNLAIIPVYLVVLFVVMIAFDLIFVNSNELDNEKQYLAYNIENTKNAYNISIEESNIEDSGTITSQEVSENRNTINNSSIVSKELTLKTLADSQTGTGYYAYPNANIGKYNINGVNQLVYLATRSMASQGRTYTNKTYEYTHGMGLIISSATSVTEKGTLEYIQKDVAGKDEVIKIEEPRTYFGVETNSIVATNTKNKQEYDYTDESGNEYTSTYEGTAGLNLNFLDRLILGISKGDLNIAFSGEITDNSKILINTNIVERARLALPNIIYDENPYTVVTESGDLVWVLDGYTVSSQYPYSQFTTIEHDNKKEKINYIRNSVKVIIDAYDGTMKFYITDRTDPIAMAYYNSYENLFEDVDSEIPTEISEHFIYPEYLYSIQAEMLNVYHNVKPDVLYRGDDIWTIANINTTNTTKSTGTEMAPYYTMVKTNDDKEDLALVQIYTPEEKQNIISYLVGKNENGSNKLKLYKFSEDSNIVGPMQLDKQIEENETIANELATISTTGTKITKNMIIVPINNTLLYIEPIYQTMLNESDVPILKKVVVASGNKVAIGDDLAEAITNLLSQSATSIEVENTDDIDGLIDAIIRANANLTKSNESNDWEMMGKDTQRLQDLISSLEKLKEEEDKKEAEEATSNNTITLNEIDNTVSNEDNITNEVIE